jgi:hypothetical protein
MIMKEIISNLRTEILASEDESQRYSLRKVWAEDKPSLAIVMMCPSSSGIVAVDASTALTIGNCYRLGYGSVTILNLFSTVNDFALQEAQEEDPENLSAIVATAEKADCLVLGAGTGKAKNKLFQKRLEQVLTALRPYESKLHCLCDENGGSRGLHPLSPRLRRWCLSKCSVSEFIDIPMEEVATKKKGKGKSSKDQASAEKTQP